MKLFTSLIMALFCISYSLKGQNLYTQSNAANIENEANTTTGWTGPAAIASVTDNPQNGTWCLRVTSNANGNRHVIYSFSAAVGTVYNISIWARRGSNNSNSIFQNWTGFQNFTSTTIESQTWTEYNFTLTASSTNPTIRVYASNGGPAGRTAYIDAITITAQAAGDTQAPTAPADLASSSITQTSLTLNWTASTDNVGVTNYRIFRNNTFFGETGSTATTFNVTGLTASTTYSFYVVAQDAAGNNSNPSNTIDATTLAPAGDTQAPTAPADLASSSITQTSLTLNWTASTDNVGVTNYRIFRNNTFFGETGNTATTFNVTGLTASTTYSFYVVAQDAAGNNSNPSNTINATTLAPAGDTQAPTAPTNLASSNITQTSLTLNWMASTDNIGVTNYRIFRNNTFFGETGSTATTFNVTGLTASTTYSFHVVAQDAAGNNSSPSNTINPTTSASSGGTPYTTTNANLPTVNWQSLNLYVAGSMGIFTQPNANFLLSVNGDIRTKDLVVQPGWSDYVFEPDYKLPTLKEVEEFIIANGRLIDIPSAAEIEENGARLGEINALLLLKIEELTLYMIETNKKIQHLKSRLETK
jgi:chitodextrinase